MGAIRTSERRFQLHQRFAGNILSAGRSSASRFAAATTSMDATVRTTAVLLAPRSAAPRRQRTRGSTQHDADNTAPAPLRSPTAANHPATASDGTDSWPEHSRSVRSGTSHVPHTQAFLIRHTISDVRGREDQPNLRHGAALSVAGGFAEFPRQKHIRKAETQQDTQTG